ncbi:marginal zone B and B1 cell-specific protein [Chamberlinius hualienensis]
MVMTLVEQWWSLVTISHLTWHLTTGDQPPANKLSFKPPKLTEEDEHSIHMPDYLKCQSCQAIAYQIQSEFTKAQDKLKDGNKRLTESKLIDIFENLCEKGFEMYGIKGIEDTKHLSGPGLETEKMPGIVQMGGKWPQRLRTMCSTYLGEVGEDKLYHVFKSNKRSMVEFLCQTKNDRIRGQCNHLATSQKTPEEREDQEEL